MLGSFSINCTNKLTPILRNIEIFLKYWWHLIITGEVSYLNSELYHIESFQNLGAINQVFENYIWDMCAFKCQKGRYGRNGTLSFYSSRNLWRLTMAKFHSPATMHFTFETTWNFSDNYKLSKWYLKFRRLPMIFSCR